MKPWACINILLVAAYDIQIMLSSVTIKMDQYDVQLRKIN